MVRKMEMAMEMEMGMKIEMAGGWRCGGRWKWRGGDEDTLVEGDQGNIFIFVKYIAGCNELGRISITIYGGFSTFLRFYVYCTIPLPDFPPTYWQIF